MWRVGERVERASGGLGPFWKKVLRTSKTLNMGLWDIEGTGGATRTFHKGGFAFIKHMIFYRLP